jgi:hypothetical protein
MTEVKREVLDFRGKQKGLGLVFLRQAAKEKQVYQAGEDKQQKTTSREENLRPGLQKEDKQVKTQTKVEITNP